MEKSTPRRAGRQDASFVALSWRSLAHVVVVVVLIISQIFCFHFRLNLAERKPDAQLCHPRLNNEPTGTLDPRHKPPETDWRAPSKPRRQDTVSLAGKLRQCVGSLQCMSIIGHSSSLSVSEHDDDASC